MSLGENAYSRIVALLKVVLPVTALAILAALVLMSRAPDVDRLIPYADVDLDALVREPRMTAPEVTGLTPSGAALLMTAGTVRQDPDAPARYLVDGIAGQIGGGADGPVLMRADAGVFDATAQTAVLTGNVVIETATGYRIESEELTGALVTAEIESPGPVAAMSPYGPLTAGHMVLRELPGDPPTHEVVFSGGVRLIYRPEQSGNP